MCGEFRQVCYKIGACWAISDSARSQNVLSGSSEFKDVRFIEVAACVCHDLIRLIRLLKTTLFSYPRAYKNFIMQIERLVNSQDFNSLSNFKVTCNSTVMLLSIGAIT